MTINFPSTTFQILRAQQILESEEQRVLIVGQKQNAGTAATGALVESVSAATDSINALFGARSIVAEMVREFKAINTQTALDVIPLDDNAGGTAATGTVGFAGTATENGSIFVEVGSGTRYRFQVDILTGDTAAIVAGKLETLIDASASAPFTAALATADVNLTAANLGTVGNDWSIFVDGAVAGITVSISGWSGGATDPVLTNLFDVVANKRYQTIVWPSVFADTTVEAFLDARFNQAEQILQGVAVITNVGTAAASIAKATALNSQSVVVIASKAISTSDLVGAAHREFPDLISTRFAAIRSLRFTDGAALGNFLTTPAALDQFGSRALASLPYANTVIPNMATIRPVDQWTQAELISFRDGGVSAIGPNRNFSAMIAGEFVTTNTTDPAANPDDSFKFLNTVDTIAAIRDAFFLNFRARYGQSRLTNGSLRAGRDLANQASIEAFTEGIYQSLAEDVLVQEGQAALADFKLNRQVIVDVAAGQVTVNVAPLLVNGLRVIVGTVTVNFGG